MKWVVYFMGIPFSWPAEKINFTTWPSIIRTFAVIITNDNNNEDSTDHTLDLGGLLLVGVAANN